MTTRPDDAGVHPSHDTATTTTATTPPTTTFDDAGTVRVLVCDDQPDVRSALREVVSGIPGFRVTAEVSTGAECLAALAADPVELLVLDVALPGGGPALARDVRREHPDLAIVVFSAHTEARVRREMLAAGADEFVPKTGRIGPLRDALLRHVPGR